MPANKYPYGYVETLLIAPTKESFYSYPVGSIELDVFQNRIIGSQRHVGRTMLADIRAKAFSKRQDVIVNRQSVTVADGAELDLVAERLGLDANLAMQGLRRKFKADRQANHWRMLWSSNLRKVFRGYNTELERVEGSPKLTNRLFLAQCMGINVVVNLVGKPGEVLGLRSISRGYDMGPYDMEQKRFYGGVIEITAPNIACKTTADQIQEVYGLPLKGVVAAFYAKNTPANEDSNLRGVAGTVVKSGLILPDDQVHFIPYRANQQRVS